jgi:hypothetical protein
VAGQGKLVSDDRLDEDAMASHQHRKRNGKSNESIESFKRSNGSSMESGSRGTDAKLRPFVVALANLLMADLLRYPEGKV